ncbi:hypothetical protein [Aliiglaciecola sp. M165]|uniref:hypothetical protein n=1 Tax=Aliiglaciecola sp. M165 TaxID=2593649 RepID=UPI0011817103|nr:hypothetical protein [Aliiglaciecola sp. M165]TRY29794.1 hypothetical protein FM019_16620 [Aliiglaciecola sp. M165]
MTKFIMVDMEGPIAATIGTANICMAVSDGKERTKVFFTGKDEPIVILCSLTEFNKACGSEEIFVEIE